MSAPLPGLAKQCHNRPEMNPHRRRRLIAYSAAVLACLAVFALYTRPEFLVTLAGQIWACF
jgi:hypothetical protein